MSEEPTVHGSVVLLGARALLIRGPSGSGKSRLAFDLILAGQAGHVSFARLVADDRVRLSAHHGRLLAAPPDELRGLIEVRGLGIRTFAFEPLAIVDRVVDLFAADVERLPRAEAGTATIAGVGVARLAVAQGMAPLPPVLAWVAPSAAEPPKSC